MVTRILVIVIRQSLLVETQYNNATRRSALVSVEYNNTIFCPSNGVWWIVFDKLSHPPGPLDRPSAE